MSVHNPSFYARRFQDFMTTEVFKKDKGSHYVHMFVCLCVFVCVQVSQVELLIRDNFLLSNINNLGTLLNYAN